MENTFIIALFAGLGGMLGWGFADFCAKKTIDKVGDVVTLVWGHIFGCVLFILFLLLQNSWSVNDISLPTGLFVWFGLIFFGSLQATVYYFLFKGFEKGQVSLLSPVFASFAGFAAILSIVIFDEVVTIGLLISLFVIYLGIILLNLDHNALSNRTLAWNKVPGFKEVAFATVLAASWTLLWGRFVSGVDWLTYSVLMYIFMTLAILMIATWQKTKLRLSDKSLYKYMFFIGLGEVVAYLSITYGYSLTSHISIVALLSGAFSLPLLILAYTFLGERITKMQLLGALTIILGIVILAIK